MTEVIDLDKPEGKVFTEKSLRIGTFLGGPLVAGYMIATNFKQLGINDKIKITWIITIGFTIAIFSLIFSLPPDIKLPRPVIPVLYTLVALEIFKKQQGIQVAKFLEDGGQKYPLYSILIIIIMGLVFTLIPIILIFIYDWN